MDMNKCPQTEEQFIAYFYQLINRRLQGNADDWKAVMEAKYDWQGQSIYLPHNTPDRYQKHPSNAPFFGLSIQWSANGAAPRIWIPSNTSDDGWYRRYIQVIKDSEISGARFQWTWKHESGGPYDPLLSDTQEPGNGGSTPPPTGDYVTKEECQRMINEAVTNCFKSGDKGYLRSDQGKYVAVDHDHNNVLIGNRDKPESWETITFIKQD